MAIGNRGPIQELIWPSGEYGEIGEIAELEQALADDQIVVRFQPIVDLRTGGLFGFEALARWAHPQRGLIEPDAFIPLAERAGLIGAVGRTVLTAACRALADWSNQRPDQSLTVAVNISASQLADPDLALDVSAALLASGIAPGRLCLEVTETALLDAAVAAAALRRLKTIGVAIGIDDFGTGYSSLSRLKRFPVDFLKIDQSFVAGLGTDPEDEAIVSAVIALGRALGLQVIAEGVETAAQLAFVTRRGCAFGQGFLWSPALPEIEALVCAGGNRVFTHAPAPASPADDGPTRPVTDAMAILVHELTTPLAVIHGYAEVVNDLPPDERPERLQQALDAILRQTQTMTAIVRSVEDMRLIEEGRLTLDRGPVDLAELAAELQRDIAVAGAASPIEVVVDSPVTADVDPARCRQILMNLITNAVSWSPPGRPVEVRLGAGSPGFVNVSVIDHGPGVPVSRGGDLFRKFSRLDHSRTGTGLGLYIARALARAHGGDLRHCRAATGGTEFVVELPSAVS
jgi:EAL domain-containing protein (putative c-di-GMP-specific phosphodiesterase class I)